MQEVEKLILCVYNLQIKFILYPSSSASSSINLNSIKPTLFDPKEKRLCHIQNRAIQRGPLLVTPQFKCDAESTQSDEIWTNQPCKTAQRDDLQIKTGRNTRLIYCFGHTILMGNEQHDFPNWVFSFPNTVPSIIDNETHEYFRIHQNYDISLFPVDFEAINHFFTGGQSHTILLDQLKEDDLDRALSALTRTHPIISIPLLFCVIVILLFSCVYLFRSLLLKSCARCIPTTNRSPIMIASHSLTDRKNEQAHVSEELLETPFSTVVSGPPKQKTSTITLTFPKKI